MQSAPNTLDDVAALLRSSNRLSDGERLVALSGGVSALVALVEGGSRSWIVKTPLAQLTVTDQWLVSRERGRNEAAVLALLDGHLGPVRTPQLIFFDEDLIILGQEFIAPPTQNLKDELLAGRAHPEIARALGEALGELHQIAPPAVFEGPGPRRLFDDLRLDPYYRTTAQRRPELREDLMLLVHDTVNQPLKALVHGDLSPKNILVTSAAPMLLDWEVIHAGDPSFDLGMMGAHYILKVLYHEIHDESHELVAAVRGFWKAYEGPADLHRSIRHLGGVVVARLYGKSPVEYLVNETSRARAHRIGAQALSGRLASIDELVELICEE